MQSYIRLDPDPVPAIPPQQPHFRCISVWPSTLQETSRS